MENWYSSDENRGIIIGPPSPPATARHPRRARRFHLAVAHHCFSPRTKPRILGGGGWIRLIIALAVFAGGPLPRFSSAPPADCEICGHLCCCPDDCAKERALLKTKDRLRDALDPCGAAGCRLDRTPPAEAFRWEERTVSKKPAIVRRGARAADDSAATSARGHFELIFHPTHINEIPTPPPRSSPIRKSLIKRTA